MALDIGTRVREGGEGKDTEACRIGSGEIIENDGDLIKVRWDNGGYPYASTRLSHELVEVPIVCSYAEVKWKRGTPWGIDGMIVVCDIHKAPANGDIYDVDPGQEGTVMSRCQGPW